MPQWGLTEGEVDQFERLRDEPVLLRDLEDVLVRDIFSTKDLDRGEHVEVAEDHHVGFVARGTVGHPVLEGGAVNTVLDGEVDSAKGGALVGGFDGGDEIGGLRHGFPGEEAVKSLSVLVVDLAVQKYPATRHE